MYLQADLTKTLRRIPWFVDLEPDKLSRLSSVASIHELQPGQVLFREGDRKDCFYVVLEGQVSLDMEVPTRGVVTFYTAEAMDVVGWSSMTPIARQRTATVRARKPSLLIGFNSELLQQICDEDCELGYIIMRRLANVVANRLLTIRLCLLDIIAQTEPQATHPSADR